MLRNKLTAASAALLVGCVGIGAIAWTDRTQASGTRSAGVQKPDPVKPEEPKADKPAVGQPPPPPDDPMLERALNRPQRFMFGEQCTSKTDPSAPRGFDLVITSARGLKGTPEPVTVRPGTIAIFRADAGVDEFTKQGGWYWQCGSVKGQSQFKEPGALIMVIRQQDGTAQWCSLHYDLRC